MRMDAIKEKIRLKEVSETDFEINKYKDDFYTIYNHCVPKYVYTAVNGLTQYCVSDNLKKSFQIPLLGASIAGELDTAMDILDSIKTNTGENPIICASKLSGYIPCLYKGKEYLIPPNKIVPNAIVISNIMVMLQRNINFLGSQNNKTVGNIDVLETKRLYGRYRISSTIWNLVSVDKKSPEYNLSQIALNTIIEYFYLDGIEQIGIYDAKENISYLIETDKLLS